MPQRCSICRHDRRREIDKALVAGDPYRHIAGAFAVSTSALRRHKAAHLPRLVQAAERREQAAAAATVAAAGRAETRHALDVREELRVINGVALAILRRAREANDDGLALKALDRIERQITLQAKLLGEIDRPANLAGSEEWAALRAKIVEALAPFPAARAAVLEALDDAG